MNLADKNVLIKKLMNDTIIRCKGKGLVIQFLCRAQAPESDRKSMHAHSSPCMILFRHEWG